MITPNSTYLAEHNKSARTPIYQVKLTVPHPLDSTLVSGLKAYWKLDETSGVRYDAIGRADLQDVNTVTSSGGKIGTAAQFVAANQEYLRYTLPDDSPLLVGDVDFGIACWVYIDSLSTRVCIISRDSRPFANGGFGGWQLTIEAGRIAELTISHNGVSAGVPATSFGALSLGTWYFIAAWHDSVANLIKISVNDGTVDSAATGGLYPPTTSHNVEPLLIGAANTGVNSAGDGTPALFFNGRIDEVSFWRKTFSSGDITALYGAGSGAAIAFTDPSIKKFCTSHPLDGEDIGQELMIPVELVQRAEIEQCRLPLSTFTFLLKDIDEDVTAIISLGIVNALCELRACFYDIGWSNAILRFTGLVTELEHDSGTYKVTARSRMAAAEDKTIFDAAKTQLTAPITAIDTVLNVADTSAFGPIPADTIWGGASMSVLIDGEFVFPGAKSTTQFAGTVRVGANTFKVPPEMPNSQATTHAAGAVVRELVNLGRLSGTNSDSGTNNLHPIDLLNTMLSVQAKFGIGELSVPPNTAELTAARAALGASLKSRFIDDQPVNAKKFIEDEIFLPCAMWPTESPSGELGAKLFGDAPVSFDASVTDSQIVAFPKWLHNAEKRINHVIYHFDYNPVTREYTSTFEYVDETLLAQHGRDLPLHIYSKGIRSPYSQTVPVALTWFGATEAFLTAASQRHIARFGSVSPVIGVSTVFRNNLLELGDDVQATFAQGVDVDAGIRQMTNAPMEVAAIRLDFETNLVELELLAYPA